MAMLGTRDVYGDTLVKLGAKNKDIVVLDADLSVSTRTAKFAEAYPERFFNMGIAEQDMISTAAGLATCGKIPFVSTFAVFLAGRAWDQVRQCVCYSEKNVKLVSTHAGITVGEDSATHQANEDIALMRILPNMTVICPADGIETARVIETVAMHKGPVYVRLARCKFPVIYDENYRFRIGKSDMIRDGSQATIIAIGIMVSHAIEAAKRLSEEGIDVRVINMSTVKPIDVKAIHKAALETGAIVTAEEHSIIGGLGSAVSEVIGESNIPCPIKRIGVKDCFGVSGKPEELLEKYCLGVKDIIEAAKDAIKRRSRPCPSA
ncbi:transketolase family protein [bacterium]|nr:transketolase family protein [bacterium]